MLILIKRTSDFIIRMMIMFVTFVVLLTLIEDNPGQATTYSALALLFVVSIILKGIIMLVDTKPKRKKE